MARTARLSLIGAASALALQAHAASLPATPANYYAVIQSAQPGDTVLLGSGTYALDAWNIVKTGEVVITPAPGATVTATEIIPNGSAFLTFRNLNVVLPAAAQYGVQAWQANHITLDGLTITGPSCTAPTGVGVSFNLSPAVSSNVLQNSTLTCLNAGVVATDADGLTINHNTIKAISDNAMIFTGVTNIAVTNNFIANFTVAAAGVHPDALQFANSSDVASAHIKLLNNHYERGTGSVAQFIFIEDGSDVDIEGNSSLGAEVAGIELSRTLGAVINGNLIQPYADFGSAIVVRGTANNITVSNNDAAVSIITSEGVGTVIQSGNTTPPVATSPTDYAEYQKWMMSSAPTPTPTPVPPTPDPLQAKLDAANAQIATDKTTIAGLSGQVTALTNQLQVANAAATAANAKATTLTTQLSAANAALAKANSRVNNGVKALTAP